MKNIQPQAFPKATATVVPTPKYVSANSSKNPSESTISINGLLFPVGSEVTAPEPEKHTGILMLKNWAREQKHRKDFSGIRIDRFARLHHISFRDAISGQQIEQINEVESYKEHNKIMEETVSTCTCTIV